MVVAFLLWRLASADVAAMDAPRAVPMCEAGDAVLKRKPPPKPPTPPNPPGPPPGPPQPKPPTQQDPPPGPAPTPPPATPSSPR